MTGMSGLSIAGRRLKNWLWDSAGIEMFEKVKDCGEGNSFFNTFHRIFYQVWVSK
jgi:hypothetical protein